MEYEHKGTRIEFDPEKCRFSAKIAGAYVRVGSLAAIKKRIDAAQAFDKFHAIVPARGWATKEKYKKTLIVGVKKPTGKSTWSNREKFVDADGKEYEENKYPQNK